MGRLSAVDLVVLLATLVAAVAIGLRFGRGTKTARSYLVGERDVPWWAVLISIVATETSGVTFLSVPGRAFVGDLTFLQLPIGYVVGRVLIARWLLPQYFEGETLTSYEVLGRRFGAGVKRASSLLFLVTRNVADGLRLYLVALPLHQLTGWPLWRAIAVVGVVTMVYSFVGGLRAVVWADVLQFFVYLAGGALILGVALDGVRGGLGGVLELAKQQGKLRVCDFDWRSTGVVGFFRESWFLGGLLGGAFLTLATHGTDQLMVQRYLCARSRRDASRALVVSGVVVLLQFAFFLGVGLALFAWFGEHPPATPIDRGDHAVAAFVAQRLTQVRGAVGLVLGAVFAVSMSTLSSSLNASAGTLVVDWLRPTRFGGRWSDATTLRTTKLATLLFGVVQVVGGIVGASVLTSGANRASSVVTAVLGIASATTGLTLGLFFLAKTLPSPRDVDERARQGRAALVAFVVMLLVVAGVWSTPIAWQWCSVVGSLGTLAIGALLVRVGRRARSPT